MKGSDVERLASIRRLVATGEARRLREAADISLSEVAGACGVDTSTVWRWEVGRRRPRGDAALRYARVLDLLSEEGRRASA